MTFFTKIISHSFRRSSSPNRTRCAGLRFGFGCKPEAAASIVLGCSTSKQSPLCSDVFFCQKRRYQPAPLLLLSKSQPLAPGCDLVLDGNLKPGVYTVWMFCVEAKSALLRRLFSAQPVPPRVRRKKPPAQAKQPQNGCRRTMDMLKHPAAKPFYCNEFSGKKQPLCRCSFWETGRASHKNGSWQRYSTIVYEGAEITIHGTARTWNDRVIHFPGEVHDCKMRFQAPGIEDLEKNRLTETMFPRVPVCVDRNSTMYYYIVRYIVILITSE